MANQIPLIRGAGSQVKQLPAGDTIAGSSLGAHTHAVGDLTQSGATTGQIIKWTGSAWAPADTTGTGTDLSFSGASSPVTLNSNTGADVTFTAGTNVTLSATGTNLTINATSGGGPSVITPSQITSDQDNYAPSGWGDATVIRLSGDVSIRGITSFSATGVSDGEEKTLCNVGSHPIYLAGEHPDGTAANRIACRGDIIIPPGENVRIVYDGTSSRWRVLTAPISSVYGGRRMFRKEWTQQSVTTGDLSETYLLSINSGTTSGSVATGTDPAGVNLQTAATSTGGYILGFPKQSNAFLPAGSSHIIASAEVWLFSLSNSTDRFTSGFMICNNITQTSFNVNNTAGIRYTDNANSGKWEGYCRNNSGTESVVDLGVTPSAQVHYDLLITLDVALSEARFYINGAYCGRVTTNLPTSTGVGCRAVHVKSVGTAATRTMVSRMSIFGILKH